MELALLAAASATVATMLVAPAIALGLWADNRLLRPLLWVLLVALAAAGAAAAAGQAVPIPAEPAMALPLVVLAALARLRAVAPGSLRIATVSGLGPSAVLRFVLAPVMAPGLLAGGALVFATVLAERAGLVSASLLPAEAVTALLFAVLARR